MALSDYPLWRAPLHHEDLEDAEEHVHWVELFYDLIHVVCVFMLGNYLSHHLSIEGFLIFAALFAVIWMAWAEASYFSSLYISTDVYHRCIMSAQVCTVMRLKRFTPRVAHFSERFALLFLIVMGEGFFKIVIALSEKGVANVSADVLFNFFLSGVIIFTLS
ncbi:low temperature requirement protein A [Leucothrix pacifica]|uniref:low temperature requirement protein A n=1 Tax=Leucothrix pacifica TaxID=1247513 RepID=UPI001C63CB67|nr:low temperature requirement protein A [Leucothrix pacifica]